MTRRWLERPTVGKADKPTTPNCSARKIPSSQGDLSRYVMNLSDVETVRNYSASYNEGSRANFGFGVVHGRAHEALESDVFEALRAAIANR